MGMPSNLASPAQMINNMNRVAANPQEGAQFSLRGGNPFKNILNLANLSRKIQRII
jgi:hypothetical protein